MPLTANKFFKVNISKDEFTATLSLNPALPAETLPPEEIVKEVSDLGIVLDDQGKKTIADFAQALGQEAPPESVVIAQGHAPALRAHDAVEYRPSE